MCLTKKLKNANDKIQNNKIITKFQKLSNKYFWENLQKNTMVTAVYY